MKFGSLRVDKKTGEIIRFHSIDWYGIGWFLRHPKIVYLFTRCEDSDISWGKEIFHRYRYSEFRKLKKNEVNGIALNDIKK